jgi:hypothetical protein
MIGNEGSWTRLSLVGKDDFLDCMILSHGRRKIRWTRDE